MVKPASAKTSLAARLDFGQSEVLRISKAALAGHPVDSNNSLFLDTFQSLIFSLP